MSVLSPVGHCILFERPTIRLQPIAGVKNPISVAKAILDYSSRRDSLGRVPPLYVILSRNSSIFASTLIICVQDRTLVSNGAHDFASASGLTTVRPDVMVSPRAQHEWKLWSEKLKGDMTGEVNHPELSGTNTVMQDTVGSVALDTFGRLAAGVSRFVRQLFPYFLLNLQ